jgi:hypothetical protein
MSRTDVWIEPATKSASGGRQLKDHILELIEWAEGLEAKSTELGLQGN